MGPSVVEGIRDPLWWRLGYGTLCSEEDTRHCRKGDMGPSVVEGIMGPSLVEGIQKPL